MPLPTGKPIDSDGESSRVNNNSRSRCSLILVIGYILITCVFGMVAFLAILADLPHVAKEFTNDGSELPLLSRIITASSRYWFALPLATSILAIDLWHRKQCSAKYRRVLTVILVVLGTIAISIIVLGAIGFYLPIVHYGIIKK